MTEYTGFMGFLDCSQEDLKILKDSRGARRTESLFVEVIQPSSRDRYEPLYSLREFENKGYPSAYRIFMSCIDENEASIKLVGSPTHWRKLCALKWFVEGRADIGFEGIESWREDMRDRDRTLLKKMLLKETDSGSVSAARALDKMISDEEKRNKVKKPTKTYSNNKSDSTITDLVKRLR